jgi:transcriptional regulator with XRE-family HTH domain
VPHLNNPEFKKDVGERLRRTREALDGRLSQTRFAKELGISKSRLSNYETGHRMLDLAVALAICEKYKVTLDWLYMNDPDRLPAYLTSRLFGLRFEARQSA